MMTAEQVVQLMASSRTEKEWDANCDKVKQDWHGYPEFWFHEIIMSGLARHVSENFRR